MRFLGIDFGWQGKPSGVAALDARGKLISMERRTGLNEILGWVEQYGDAAIAIDAPIVIPNQTGMRPADKLMHRHFGRYHAGCYPANLNLPSAHRCIELSAALAARGFRHAADLMPRQRGRFQLRFIRTRRVCSSSSLIRSSSTRRAPSASAGRNSRATGHCFQPAST
jgi:predicted RNase H-like nuclease